jgi:hypothetical protein
MKTVIEKKRAYPLEKYATFEERLKTRKLFA